MLSDNYGHDDFSIGLYRDNTPHVESELMIYGAKYPFLWPYQVEEARLFPQKLKLCIYLHFLAYLALKKPNISGR